MPRGNFASFSLFSLAGFMSLQVGLSIGYTRSSLEKTAWTLSVWGTSPSGSTGHRDVQDTELSADGTCPASPLANINQTQLWKAPNPIVHHHSPLKCHEMIQRQCCSSSEGCSWVAAMRTNHFADQTWTRQSNTDQDSRRSIRNTCSNYQNLGDSWSVGNMLASKGPTAGSSNTRCLICTARWKTSAGNSLEHCAQKRMLRRACSSSGIPNRTFRPLVLNISPVVAVAWTAWEISRLFPGQWQSHNV